MKKLLITLIVTALVLPAFAEKPEWTYIFYSTDKTDYNEICKGAEHVDNGQIIAFNPEKKKAFEIKSCNSSKPSNISTKSVGSLFKDVKKNYASEKYLLFIGKDISGIDLQGQLKGTRTDVLMLDTGKSGSIEAIWDYKDSVSFLASLSTERIKGGLNITELLKNAGKGRKSPDIMAEAFVKTYETQAQGIKMPVAAFALDTSEYFHSAIGLFEERASCFNKKMQRFPKVMAKSGTHSDYLMSTKVINKVLMKKMEKAVIANFGVNTDLTAFTFYLPKDKATYDKTVKQFESTKFAKDHPDWVTFLAELYKAAP